MYKDRSLADPAGVRGFNLRVVLNLKEMHCIFTNK